MAYLHTHGIGSILEKSPRWEPRSVSLRAIMPLEPGHGLNRCFMDG